MLGRRETHELIALWGEFDVSTVLYEEILVILLGLRAVPRVLEPLM